MAKTTKPTLSFENLKRKQREIRSTFPEPLGLRLHRSISWLGRAEKERTDHDVRFILLWIGFNSAYATDIQSDTSSERVSFKVFFDTLVKLDSTHRIYDAVWARFSQEIRNLLDNKYVFAPFWHHQNGLAGHDDWESRLEASGRNIAKAMQRFDTPQMLAIVFDRLYILRNQIVHGGATWNSSINRGQVRDGTAVMGWMLPIFIDVMMDHPEHDWGQPYYPVIR